MNELTVYENLNLGNVRTLTIEGEPWFVGKDVAEILGYSKARNAISAHVDDDDDKKDAPIQGDLGGVQNMTIINESGLYSLILSSKLPKAKEFKHWVTKEVLPAIRKTGSYSMQNGYHTALSPQEVKDLIRHELALACIKVENHLGLSDMPKETPSEPPKRLRTKLGRLPERERADVDKIIKKSSSCEQAAYKIQMYLNITISASGVRNYAIEAGLR